MSTEVKPLRRHAVRGGAGALPDGVGGTITGGPVQPIDLMQVLDRRPRQPAPAFGAAKWAVTGRFDKNSAVALSDGSRIFFASIEDVRVLPGA